jgi:hypothetical protein
MSDKLDLTIDICVLRSGSNTGEPMYYESSLKLMQLLKRDKSYWICLDDRGKIELQYRKQLQGTYGHHWLREMASKKKVKIVEWSNLDRGTRTALIEAHFDSSVGEDIKYVITAKGSESRILVTHDKDYSPKVRRILRKRLEVVVKSATDISS